MKTIRCLAAAFTLAVLAPLGERIDAASAPETECRDQLSGSIDGNVVVPAGVYCTIPNATVRGNVRAAHAQLRVFGSHVTGSIQAEVSAVTVVNSIVDGNLRVEATPPGNSNLICEMTVHGNVEFIA